MDDELNKLDAGFQVFQALPSNERKGETPKKLVQVPLDLFFQRDLPGDLRGGDGDRPPHPGDTVRDDMDIVIDESDKTWFGRTRFIAGVEAVRVHIEVGAFGEWRKHKVVEELDSLHRSIAEAQAGGTKCWTALVLIGNEWTGATKNIGRCLHDYYHDKNLRRSSAVPPPYRYSWPFIDAVVLPGMYLMKHDLFEEDGGRLPSSDQYATWRARPVLASYPLSPRDPLEHLRPLTLTRAYLRRYLRQLASPNSEVELWNSEAEQRQIEGPPITQVELDAWRAGDHFICLDDDAPEYLWHWDGPSWRALARGGAVCKRKSNYAFHSDLDVPARSSS